VRRRMERKGEKDSEEDDYFNKFPRQCLQWFLKIDQSECSKSPIDLHQRNNTCVVWYLIVNTLKVKLVKLCSVVLKEMTKM
jgi:hypothetical protein